VRERFSLGLTQTDLALLLSVDAEWVFLWEREALPLPSSYLCELVEIGMDTVRLALGAPGVWLPGSLLPDARLLRYCWRGLSQGCMLARSGVQKH